MFLKSFSIKNPPKQLTFNKHYLNPHNQSHNHKVCKQPKRPSPIKTVAYEHTEDTKSHEHFVFITSLRLSK